MISVPQQCHLSVSINASCQCPSVPSISVTNQYCQSVPPISASQCCLSVPYTSAAFQFSASYQCLLISAAYQCPSQQPH
ncbi:unnamed protein product [Staurois parvus]|uniref:Uncharacterized protein n=1 Tax=Staurois parvus TaxID=386267 RepID=A0ABN9A9Y2_9NEOB|nr:unnamed protein product [Staurois parvus]